MHKLVINLGIPVKKCVIEVHTAVNKYSHVPCDEDLQQQGRYIYQRRLQWPVHGCQNYNISNNSQLQVNKRNRWNQGGRKNFMCAMMA